MYIMLLKQRLSNGKSKTVHSTTEEYYTRLMDVRFKGDWENWVKFFLKAVSESAGMANLAALEIH
jgi:Fic family protein